MASHDPPSRLCLPSGLGCVFGLFALAVLGVIYAAIAAAWLAWAALVLPAALVARLSGRAELANRMAGTLLWNLKALRK
jgi:hypothetical protein